MTDRDRVNLVEKRKEFKFKRKDEGTGEAVTLSG